MSPPGWEYQALESIQGALGHADPKLASLLATFSRLASGDKMPAHEKIRSPLRHPPRRRRPPPRRGKAPHRHRSLQRAAILAWLITSLAMITVAVILSRGGPAPCPHAFGICAVSQPAGHGGASPPVGPAAAGTITPLMCPAAPATVIPLVSPADRGTMVKLMGPADPGTATSLMLPRR